MTRFQLPRRQPDELTDDERQVAADRDHDAAVQLLIDALSGPAPARQDNPDVEGPWRD